jgi:hypothetical protein
MQDYQKEHREKLASIKSPSNKDDVTLSKINYPSVATNVNAHLEKFAKSILRHIEGKTKKVSEYLK